MEHDRREEQGALIVSFEGEVDLEHSPKAREVLLESVGQEKRVLVDLSGVTYIDSSGIACLVEALQVARNYNADLALIYTRLLKISTTANQL